jgi:hypothetical protein
MEATMRRLLLSLALALTLSAVGASTALAAATQGAQTAPLYGPFTVVSCPPGGTPTPETFGFVVLNTPGNEATLSGEVAVRNGAPNATFPVEVKQGCGFVSTFVGELTTNKKGNGNLHFTTTRAPGATLFYVDVKSPTQGFRFVSPAVELD